MSAPSIARARPHVIGSTCRLAGVMPAPNPHSDRPGFDRLGRSCHECRLTSDAAHLLVGAVAVTFSLRYVRASCLPPLRSCPDHVSSRSEAPLHASADAHPALCAVGHRVPPRVAHLDECRVPSPAASLGPSPAPLGGCLGLASRLGGGEARRFEAGYAICVPRLAAQRRFAVCAEDDDRLVQRRRATFPGHWEPYLHALHTPSWFHDER